MKKTFEQALEQFKAQFDVSLEFTGHSNSYDENDGIGEEEYWVEGLITSKVDSLQIQVGGWFSHDTRDGMDCISCLLVIRINNETIGECEGIQGFYNSFTNQWDGNLVWDTF